MPISLGTSQPAQALKTGAAKLWILLIGVNHYQEDTLPSLQYPAPDTQGLAQALEEATQAFPSKELYIYHDFAQAQPTAIAIRQRLDEITRAAQSQDTVLVYFSGHGIFDDEAQQVVLCLSDTRKQSLHQTGLPLQELLQVLNQSLARRQLLWLDACHSGGLTLMGSAKIGGPKRGRPKGGGPKRKDVIAPSIVNDPTPQMVDVLRQRAAQGEGFYAMLSCDQTQRSWEFPELGHGVFTYFLMQGLRGEAADAQGTIDADGLYKYVYHQTLRYIDKANQQIRLVNRQTKSQQKSQNKGQKNGRKNGRNRSKENTELYIEYSLQTPKRIVEGMGEMVLGMRPPEVSAAPRRRALIIDGLRGYQKTLALSKVLQNLGQYAISYWPQPGQGWEAVKEAIQTCLNPMPAGEHSLPPTVLLYLRGHLGQSSEGEAWLELGDGVRIYRSWLRRALRQAQDTQQLIVLDCPESPSGTSSGVFPGVSAGAAIGATDSTTTLTDWIEDLQIEGDRGQCIIAAASLKDQPEQFAQALLETLSETDSQMGLPVAAWISQLQLQLAGTPLAQGIQDILPLSWLSGTQGVIEVVPSQVGIQAVGRTQNLDLGVCPYMGLRAFGLEQSQYFYGRDGLTQQLIEGLRQGTSLAVVGASGSGKSSVLQAGVLAQLYQGKQIPGSEQWWIRVVRPGATPFKTLAQQLIDPGTERERSYQAMQIEGLLYQGSDGFVQWLRSRPEPTVTLMIDQFEELFTLAPESERGPFLDLLFEALHYASDRFKLVLAIRADFVPNCLAYPALADLLQNNSMLVPPRLTPDAYREAIFKPAEQVGLQIESGLVELLLQEVDQAAGELPLLEFVLEKLWENRHDGKLTLVAYQQLGGLRGALERQAQAVYESLTPEAQDCARWIFLALTQLGDGTEDTRRRVLKSDLVVAKYPRSLVDETLRVLSAAKLVVIRADETPPVGYSRGPDDATEDIGEEAENKEVTEKEAEKNNNTENNKPKKDASELPAPLQSSDLTPDSIPESTSEPTPEPTVEVVHESLIRHWSTLRWWLEENRSRLQLQRQLSQLAADWQVQEQPDFLLTGVRLAEAEDLYIKYTDELSETVQRFIEAGLTARQQRQQLEKRRLRRVKLTAAAIGLLGLVSMGMAGVAYRQNVRAQLQNVKALNASSEALLSSHQQLDALQQGIQSGRRLQGMGWLSRQIVGQRRWSHLQLQTAGTLEQALRFGREANRLERHSQAANAVQFSVDGQRLASASNDGSVIVWRRDGSVLAQLMLATEGARATDVRWVPGATSATETAEATLLIATNEGTVELWQVDPKGQSTLQKTFSGHSDWVTSVAVSPDGAVLASASRDRTIRLWKRDGTPIRTLSGHTGWVNRVRFSPDSQTLASASEDGTIRIWKRDGSLVKTLGSAPTGQTPSTKQTSSTEQRAEQGAISSSVASVRITNVAFSPNGQTLAATRNDGSFGVWNLATGALQYEIMQAETDTSVKQNRLTAIAFSADGATLAVAGADAKIQLWRAADGLKLDPLRGHTGEITDLSFSPEGELASASADGTLRLWQLRSPSSLADLGIHGVAVSPTATKSAKQPYLVATADYEGGVTLWEHRPGSGSETTSEATVLKTLKGHEGAAEAVAFNPAGTHLASVGADSQVILWRVAGGTRLAAVTDHGDRVTSVAFSHNGQLLATGSADKTIRLWSVTEDSLTPLATLTGHTDAVTSVSFHPRKPLLLSGSYDKTVRLWQILAKPTANAKATLIQTMTEPNEGVSAVQFSPMGDSDSADSSVRLAAASWDSQLYIWQLQGLSPQLHKTLDHNGGVSALTFSADGQTLVSGSASGMVQLWDSQSGQRLKRLFGEAGAVNALGLSSDGQLLVSGAIQGGLGLWDMQLPMLMDSGCDRLGSYLRTNPTLTPEARTLCDN
ncbi:MAG: caspase family protein [Cyanobacteria bacterium P01_F01_bin.53]